MKPTPASKSASPINGFQYAFLVRDFLGRPDRTETQGQQNLLRYYASRNKHGQFNPGMDRIEQDTGLCQQTITDYNNYYKNLGILGWIRGCGTGGNEGGSGQSNLYQLNAQKLQELSGKTIPATTPVPVEARVSATTPFGAATTPVGVPKYQAQKNQANTNTSPSGESMANPTDNDTRHDSQTDGMASAKNVHDTKPSAAASANAMALARMISPNPSADQAMKLEDAANAFKPGEYQRAIKWAQSGANEWWATKVSVGMVAKHYHKLMDDYKAANPDARADDQVIAELTKPKRQQRERKTDERMCNYCGAEGLEGREFPTIASPDAKQPWLAEMRCKACGKTGHRDFYLSEIVDLNTGEVTIAPKYVFNLGRMVMPKMAKAKAAKAAKAKHDKK